MTAPRTMAALRALSDAELGNVPTSEVVEALFEEATGQRGLSGRELALYRAELRGPWLVMFMLDLFTQRSDVILRVLLSSSGPGGDEPRIDEAVGRFYRGFRVVGLPAPAHEREAAAAAEESARLAAWLVEQYQTSEHHPPRITLGEAIDALGREHNRSTYPIVAEMLRELGWDKAGYDGTIRGFYWSPTPAARGEDA